MNAKQMLAKLDGYGGIIPFNSEELEVTLRALRLLAAAEGGEGTPETDALHHRLVKASEGPQWIAGKDYCDMKDHARTLEQRCAALAARVRELEADIVKAERRAERLKGHAEAMAVALDIDGERCSPESQCRVCAILDAYRADEGE